MQDDQSACNFFFLYYFTCSWNWNFPAFSCALKFHGNTTGFTQEKRRKHFFFIIRVDIRSKLASARFRYAIAYSACCKGLAFHCLLMSELMFGLKDMTGGARTVRGIDAILAKKKKSMSSGFEQAPFKPKFTRSNRLSTHTSDQR